MIIRPYNMDRLPRRKQLRVKGYDYSQNGYYFVTICTQNKGSVFGRIRDNKMHTNNIGEIAHNCWNEIPLHYPFVQIDEFVVMPNHVHGVIVIANKTIVGANDHSPLQRNNVIKGTSRTLGAIIRGFKIGVVMAIKNFGYDKPIWQRNYFEHIIRSDEEFQEVRRYIADNPKNWKKDKLYFE